MARVKRVSHLITPAQKSQRAISNARRHGKAILSILRAQELLGLTKDELVRAVACVIGSDHPKADAIHHGGIFITKPGTVHVGRLYRNGAHAGNVSYEIETWGGNDPIKVAEIQKRLDGFIADMKVL